MKHFLEAQGAALQALQDPANLIGLLKVCLIVDVQGKLHVLAVLEDSTPTASAESTLRSVLQGAAEDFWSGELLLQRSKNHCDRRSNPADEPLFAAIWKEAKPTPQNQAKTFLLERRFSKESWFDASPTPPWALHPRTPRVVSFYSFKGGVGRTTALAAVALQLARDKQRVVLLDFDLEAPGLGSIFPPPSQIAPSLGLLDYLIEFPVLGTKFPLEDVFYAYDDQKALQGGEPIQVGWSGMPGEDYLAKLSRLNLHRLLAPLAVGGGSDDPIHHLLRFVKTNKQPDWILIDSRAGLHDLGGLALSGLAHWHVLFGLDSSQSWAGLGVAVARLGKLLVQTNAPQADCLLVQASVPPPPIAETSKARFLARSHEVFSNLYYARPEEDPDDKFYVLEDRDSTDAPHYPISLAHDLQIMGYQSATEVADRLCEGDFKRLATILRNRVDNSMPA